jgi:iron-sulfur cluster repair protein YtfE (RIC family)
MATYGDRWLGRDMATLAGGLAMGVVASRVLPPIIAAATGSVRVMLGESPFEQLKRDHRRIFTLLDTMLAADEALGEQDALFLVLKRTIAKHALAEEDVVYPVLHTSAGAADAAKRLYEEHADVKIHLYAIETALKSHGNASAPLRSLNDLLSRHIRDEEDVEFPKLQALMDARESRAASGQIRREEAMIL